MKPVKLVGYPGVSSPVLGEIQPAHTGFAGNAEATQAHTHGWGLALVWLQAYVARGETVSTRG